MAQQLVYFNNPSDITLIQGQIGVQPGSVNTTNLSTSFFNNSRVYTINNKVYTGAASLINSSLQSLMSCPSGTSYNQDYNGVAHHGLFCVAGNAFSGDEIFTSTGTANVSGASWTSDKYVRLASQSKIIGGMVIAKMMEEGYLASNDTVSKYIPQFTGTAYYINYATGTIGNYTSGPGNYTGTVLPFDLSSVTVSQLLGFQLGIPSSEFLTGQSFASWQTTTPADFALNYSYQTCGNALNLGRSLGPTGCLNTKQGLRDSGYDGFYKSSGIVYGPVTDYILSLCNCLNNGSVILSFKPGDLATGFNGLQVPRAQYGVAMTIMSYVCQQALFAKTNSYTNLAQYIREKIFTPLEINDGLWWGGCETGPADRVSNTIDTSFRRGPALYSGPFATGTIIAPLNTLVWTSQYSNDSFASPILPQFNWIDPPNFNGGLIGKPSLYCKLLRLLITKGVYINSSNQTIQILSRPAVNWMFNSFGAAGQLFEAKSLYNNGTPTANQKWCLGFTRQDDSLASSYNIENSGNIGFNCFPISPGLCNWGGFYGTQYAFDIDSGYYICAGSQEPGSCNTVNYMDFQRVLVPLLSYLSRLN